MRSDKEVKRARSALKLAGVPLTELDEGTGPEVGRVAISTMHSPKGSSSSASLSCRAMTRSFPRRSALKAWQTMRISKRSTTERHLLYVACTRARDHLLVTGAEPVSEFVATC